MSNDTKSFWLGAIGITIFAFTLPMTKLATGSVANPELSPWFVSFGRAAFAGMLSVIYLYFTHAPRPQKGDASLLALAALGNGLGWPIFLALGLQYVESTHAAVMTGILPLATAALAAVCSDANRRCAFGFFQCWERFWSLRFHCCAVAMACIFNGQTVCWYSPCYRRRWGMCLARNFRSVGRANTLFAGLAFFCCPLPYR